MNTGINSMANGGLKTSLPTPARPAGGGGQARYFLLHAGSCHALGGSALGTTCNLNQNIQVQSARLNQQGPTCFMAGKNGILLKCPKKTN